MGKYKLFSELSKSGKAKRKKVEISKEMIKLNLENSELLCEKNKSVNLLYSPNYDSENSKDSSLEIFSDISHGSNYFDITSSSNTTTEVSLESTEKIKDLKSSLVNWTIKYNIKKNAVSDLLKILNEHKLPTLPFDSRTLLKTPRVINIHDLKPGHLVYLGLEKNIRNILQHCGHIPETLLLDLNIDGAPVYKNSNQKGTFWPILGRLVNVNSPVFAISVYCGPSKPDNFHDFISPFVIEYNSLKNSFFYDDKNIVIKLNNIVLDTPAKCAVCGTTGHTGYGSCPRCHILGQRFLNKTVFPELDFPLRTNEEFRNKLDKNHNKSFSAFEDIPEFDMIKGFPIDYLHNVLLGATKKLLDLWFSHKGIYPPSTRLRISSKIEKMTKFEPQEFNRKLRGLNKLGVWKGKEFRTFLLFIGPLALKNEISGEHFNHFMLLHTAISILIQKDFCIQFNNAAKQILKLFIQDFEVLYGLENMTHNIHLLYHLPDDCIKNGPLDYFSAFKYESYLGKLKNLIQSSYKPLEQIHNRISEIFQATGNSKNFKHNEKFIFKDRLDENTFSKLWINGMLLNCNSDKDCYVQTFDRSLLKVTKICSENDKYVVHAKKFIKIFDIYNLPIKSKKIDAFIADSKEVVDIEIDLKYLKRKMFCIPIENNQIHLYPMTPFDDNDNFTYFN